MFESVNGHNRTDGRRLEPHPISSGSGELNSGQSPIKNTISLLLEKMYFVFHVIFSVISSLLFYPILCICTVLISVISRNIPKK